MFLCAVLAGITLYNKIKVNVLLNTLRERTVNELKNSEFPLNAKGVYAMHMESEWLKGKKDEALSILQGRALPEKNITPLDFKEELLGTELKLKQLADIQRCAIPDKIGFSEYAGGEIPLANETVLLYKQLKVTDEIVSLLLKYKVNNIKSIERLQYIYRNEDNLYEEIAVRINIDCVYENLLRVMADLPNLPFFAVVRAVKIEKIDESSVSADIIIGAVDFLNKS